MCTTRSMGGQRAWQRPKNQGDLRTPDSPRLDGLKEDSIGIKNMPLMLELLSNVLHSGFAKPSC